MTDERGSSLSPTHSGGLETLDETRRQRVRAVRDVQLERATDFLKGLLFTGPRR